MHWEELETINCARGRDEAFPHKTVLMPAVNLFGAEFTPRISTLPLQAGIGSSGTRGLRGCILGRTKGNNFNTTLSRPAGRIVFGKNDTPLATMCKYLLLSNTKILLK